MFRPYKVVIIRPIQNKSSDAVHILGPQLCISFGLIPEIAVSWMWIFLLSVETMTKKENQRAEFPVLPKGD
jgi:hypothetical protein